MTIDRSGHQLPFFGNCGLNVTIIGIGVWGCEVLKHLISGGFPHALTIALGTDDESLFFRHPAARIIYVGQSDHSWAVDVLKNLLTDCGLLICLVSGLASIDIETALTTLELAGGSSDCKSIAITGSGYDSSAEDLKRAFNSVLSVDDSYPAWAHNVISGYLSTIINIMFNHRLLAVEYFELISFTADRIFELCDITKNDSIRSESDEIVFQVQQRIVPKISRAIICIEYSRNSRIQPMDLVTRLRELPIPLLISFVPTKSPNATLALTVICFK